MEGGMITQEKLEESQREQNAKQQRFITREEMRNIIQHHGSTAFEGNRIRQPLLDRHV